MPSRGYKTMPSVDDPRAVHLDRAIAELGLTQDRAYDGIAASEVFMRAVLVGKRQFDFPQLVQAFSDWLAIQNRNR